MTHTDEDKEAEFHGDAGHVAGVATYDITIERYADPGSKPCWHAMCAELVSLRIDGLTLTRDQVEEVCTKNDLIEAEGMICERYQEKIDTGNAFSV